MPGLTGSDSASRPTRGENRWEFGASAGCHFGAFSGFRPPARVLAWAIDLRQHLKMGINLNIEYEFLHTLYSTFEPVEIRNSE